MKSAGQLASLSHHAYCLVGGASARADLVSTLEKKHRISAQGNTDFFDRTYAAFSIDDAREVKAAAQIRPVSESGLKIFMLTMAGITSEAQNALLKLLEEPPEYARFFIIIPSAHLLLPTVKSRLSFLGGDSGGNGSHPAAAAEAKAFLALAPAKRLDYVKSFMEAITKEKRPKQDAVDLINALQEAVRAKAGGAEGLKAQAAFLEAIELARRYMNDRAPSLKMLLEYVALAAS